MNKSVVRGENPVTVFRKLSDARYTLPQWFIAAALFFSAAAFTLWQNSHVAVLWDLSYLLDSSYRIALGQIPYRDFPFSHAPLTFLLHAAIIKLFGRVYFPHILCAAIEAGLAAVLLWRILLRQLTPLAECASLVALLLAAPLTVLGIYSIYPHPVYDSDCILVVLLALYQLQRANESISRNVLAGTLCVLPLFFKQNIGLPFLLVTLASVALVVIVRLRQRVSVAPQVGFVAGASATLAAALLLIHATAGLHNYFFWTITFAAQRRLIGPGVLLYIYHQPSLLWTLPASLAAFALLRCDKWVPHPFRALYGKGESQPRLFRLCSIAAFLLLAAPFFWIIVGFALSDDPSDRADQLLSLWPHLLLLAAILAVANLRPSRLLARSNLRRLLPLILLATIHGTFLSQQLWGSTYAIWPLLALVIADLLAQVPTVARPLAVVIAVTFFLCGAPYATSHERLSYIHLDGPEVCATLPALGGLTTPGPWIPAFEDLVHDTNVKIPSGDNILLVPGDVPFYFATGREPRFPILLFDPATNPYTAHQTLDLARAHNVRWLIFNRNSQMTAPPEPGLPDLLNLLQQDFSLDRTVSGFEIYRRK
jgi:hypothetical protein